MADTKNETVSTNPMKLDWPTDTVGMTQRLQREGCRAIGRMGGDDANYKTVMAVLKVLAKHAKVKLDDQKADLTATIAKAVETRATAARVSAESEARKEAALVSQINSLDKRLKTIRGK